MIYSPRHTLDKQWIAQARTARSMQLGGQFTQVCPRYAAARAKRRERDVIDDILFLINHRAA